MGFWDTSPSWHGGPRRAHPMMDLVKVVDARLQVLTGRVDDLERVCGVLIARLTDLEALVVLVAGRDLPGDHGRRKFAMNDGTVKPMNRGPSDAPESPEPTDREQLTLENRPC